MLAFARKLSLQILNVAKHIAGADTYNYYAMTPDDS